MALYILSVRSSQHSREATEGTDNAIGDTLQPSRELREDWAIVLPVRCLLGKHEDLSSILRTHMQRQLGMVAYTCDPSIEVGERGS